MDNWYNWLTKTRYEGLDKSEIINSQKWLNSICDFILNFSKIKRTDTVIDVGCGLGFLGLKILEAQKGLGNVIFLDSDEECLNECQKRINNLKINSGYMILNSDCSKIPLENNFVDNVVIRSVLAHVDNKKEALSEIYRIMKYNSIICDFEPVISQNKHYWEILPNDLVEKYSMFKNYEEIIWNDMSDSLLNYDYTTLHDLYEQVGFSNIKIIKHILPINMKVDNEIVDSWFNTKPAPNKKSLKEKFLLYEKESFIDEYINEIKKGIIDQYIRIESNFCFIIAEKLDKSRHEILSRVSPF